MKLVLRKGGDSLLIDHKLPGASHRIVEFRGRGPLHEKIVYLHPRKSGLSIRNLRMALGKPEPHMNDAELILPRKRDRLRGNGHYAFGIRHEAEDSFLKI